MDNTSTIRPLRHGAAALLQAHLIIAARAEGALPSAQQEHEPPKPVFRSVRERGQS